MAAVAVALLSSCEEKLIQQEVSVEVLPAEEQMIFTADLGVDTKTYLEYQDGVFKTRWREDDNIFIMALNTKDTTYWRETADIIEGAGTSVAKFAASANVKGDKYVAYYGGSTQFTAMGEFYPMLQEYQYRYGYYNEEGAIVWENSLDGYYYPMYAESTTTSFSFKNLCSILKVDLVGTDYIENVIFTPNDPSIPVAGRTKLVLENGKPELVFVNDTTTRYQVCFYVQETLNPTEPVSCYISLPAQTYNGGFTLTINSGSGSMQVKTTENIKLDRSQIRSIPAITYENQTTNTWALCGVMTDWTTDIVMTPYEGYHVLVDQYLEAGQEFKFRANGNWEVNYGYNYQAIDPGTTVQLTPNGSNMYVTQTGIYQIILDPNEGIAQFVRTDAEEPEYVECASYDEVAALPDNTLVMVQGFVMVPYGRGFVMNIGQYWSNCILVYQGTDQSYYTPVMGNVVALIAEKVTYNGLPELTNIKAVEVVSDQVVDLGYNRYYDLVSPEAFNNIQIDRYEYVKYAGTLQKSGNYYNVIVDGAPDRMGSLEFPIQDLTEFLDKKVLVEGWFIGFTGGGKYLKTVVRSIAFVDDSGSAEDVVPGDDIIVTTRKSKKIAE